MSESNSVIRLSESDAIEAGIIESSEFKYVVDEAIITCSNAEIENFPNNLMVDSQSKFYMHSRLVATKADNKPFININPFKCSCKFGECRPKFENTWENYVENITVAGNEPLYEKSTLKCTRYGEIGIISIIDTGQRLISDEINEISEMLKNIAQQGGTKQERLQKMTDYLRKKYGKDVNVSDFNYENFGKGSVLDLTFGEDPIHFINNSEGEIFKHVDEYNKEGVFFKKERRRLNEAGQPRVYEDEIVGNFYTNSAQYKYIKTMSPQTIKKITDGWQMEENEIRKAVSAQHPVIDKLIKAPHTVEMTIDYNSLNTDVIYWSQPRALKKKEEAVQKKLEGITKIPGIEGVDVVGYKKDKNGNTVLVVRDYRNILNEKDKQGIWNEYRKRGIKIENDAIGMFNSTVHATNVYNYLGGSYNDKYADGGLIAPLSTGIGVGKGYVVTRALKANGYINEVKKKNIDEDSAFKGGYRKNPINEELHRKINERGKEHYANLQADKRVNSVTAPIDFDNHIINGEINSIGRPSGGHSTLGNVLVVGDITEYSNGVRGARIRVPDPYGPNGYPRRTKFSTLFPEHWTANRIKVEVDAAYKNRNINGNKWKGTTPSKIEVEGFLTPNTTVYPLIP